MAERTNKLPADFPTQVDVAHRTLAFRTDLDKLLKAHDAKLLLQWEGKHVTLMVRFPNVAEGVGATMTRTKRGGRVRYVLDEEEATRG